MWFGLLYIGAIVTVFTGVMLLFVWVNNKGREWLKENSFGSGYSE